MEFAALEKAKAFVEELVKYRDEYISIYGIDKALQKNNDVELKIKDTLQELDQLQLSIDNKAQFFYLRGRALNISSKYNAHAEECLSKAVKLDPNLIEGWNELGESYWKNKNIEAACNCFTGAIAKKKNKVSLRNLSMVQRQLGKDYKSKIENIKESVSTAREAVSLDVSDGKSWFVLGNAFLSLFFFTGQNPVTLKSAMAAYKKAVNDKIENSNPDLHYNQAVAFKFEENYPEALSGFKMAALLDPSWEEAKMEKENLLSQLKSVMETITKKGNLKEKKVNQYVNALKDSDFGPYSCGTYTSPLNRSVSLQKVFFKDLVESSNENMVVAGKVISIIPVKDNIPFCCIVMDKNGECLCLNIFNLAKNRSLIIGDTLAIPEPYLQLVCFHHEDEEIKFRSLRVSNPLVLVINKRKVGTDRLSYSVLSMTNKSE